MPSRRLPNSVPTVLRTLTTARDMYKNTANPADRAISAALFAQLDDTVPTSFLNRFLKEASDVDLSKATQAPRTSAFERAMERLAKYCSHFHQVLDLGIERGAFSPGARAYYGRDIHATTLPALTTHADILEVAGKIITGEAARQAAESGGTWDGGATWDSDVQWDGTFRPMALPSAAEIATLLAEVNTDHIAAQQAIIDTDREREESMALLPEGMTLSEDVCDTVEFFYRHDPDASSRRAKCERWGVVYRFEEPPPAPPTPPTPPPGP